MTIRVKKQSLLQIFLCVLPLNTKVQTHWLYVNYSTPLHSHSADILKSTVWPIKFGQLFCLDFFYHYNVSSKTTTANIKMFPCCWRMVDWHTMGLTYIGSIPLIIYCISDVFNLLCLHPCLLTVCLLFSCPSWLIATFLGALPLPPVSHWNIINMYHIACMCTHGIQATLTVDSSTHSCPGL